MTPGFARPPCSEASFRLASTPRRLAQVSAWACFSLVGELLQPSRPSQPPDQASEEVPGPKRTSGHVRSLSQPQPALPNLGRNVSLQSCRYQLALEMELTTIRLLSGDPALARGRVWGRLSSWYDITGNRESLILHLLSAARARDRCPACPPANVTDDAEGAAQAHEVEDWIPASAQSRAHQHGARPHMISTCS